MPTFLAKDDRGNITQVVSLEGASTQQVTVSGVSASTSVVTSSFIRVACTTDCHIVVSDAPTAAVTDTWLPAGVVEYYHVREGVSKVAFIQTTAGGTGYVTSLG